MIPAQRQQGATRSRTSARVARTSGDTWTAVQQDSTSQLQSSIPTSDSTTKSLPPSPTAWGININFSTFINQQLVSSFTISKQTILSHTFVNTASSLVSKTSHKPLILAYSSSMPPKISFGEKTCCIVVISMLSLLLLTLVVILIVVCSKLRQRNTSFSSYNIQPNLIKLLFGG